MRRTFHLKSDSALPVFSRKSKNKPDDRSRGTAAIIAAYCTVSAARVAGPCCAYEHTALKGRVHGKDTDEDSSWGQVVEVGRGEAGKHLAVFELWVDVLDGVVRFQTRGKGRY